MPRHRYQTYVFDTTPNKSPPLEVKIRDILGPAYKDAPPCAWMDGHALREKLIMENFIRDIRDNGHIYSGQEIAEQAEKIFDELGLA